MWFSLIIFGADAARRHLTRRSTERWIEGLRWNPGFTHTPEATLEDQPVAA